jgi:hypothetical protein
MEGSGKHQINGVSGRHSACHPAAALHWMAGYDGMLAGERMAGATETIL